MKRYKAPSILTLVSVVISTASVAYTTVVDWDYTSVGWHWANVVILILCGMVLGAGLTLVGLSWLANVVDDEQEEQAA